MKKSVVQSSKLEQPVHYMKHVTLNSFTM